ncbi:transporter substrate-binding domain-containing protein [Sulfurimonas sp. MAG313]|nr:transporter substrate-binding domain-containing protein [Sulfurimonas sp. MAG313]MDF1881789.1 transporter substrate-binding domain-containing protein [Sulfurimonas sp. MAG313]
MIYKPSFLHENGMPVEVGSVKVYYNIHELKDIEISYIPDIKIFKDLSKEEYTQIKKAYKHLSIDFVLSKLSIHEQKWIQKHPVIRFVGDPNWLPFEAFDAKGNYIGIVSEYLKEIEDITGLRFEKIQTATWEESVRLIKDKKADMISETTDSELSSFLTFTNSYLQNYIVIVMKSKAKYVDEISQIQDKRIVIMKDYGYVSKIKKAYPQVNFIEAEDISQALKIVSSGKADALLCTMALGAYHISKGGFINLRIVGKTEFSTSIGYGIQKEMKPLVSILNKSILALDEGKKQEILKKWITQKYVEKMDYTLAWQVLGAAFILLALFWYWNRQMQKEIKRRIEVEEQLYEVNTQVKESIEFSSMIQRALIPDKKEFETFFSDYFTLWKPRDIVGGDIYFFEVLRHKEEGILMVIDCTGHGVPGAFITMLVKALERNMISYIVSKKDDISPAELLKVFNKSIKHLLKQHDKSAESNAGFDAGILYINKKDQIARYAGAELSLYYSDNTEIKRVKGDRQSVGYRSSDLDYVYKDYEIVLEKNMKFYITTDGYQDQNGGAKGFPFGRKRFQNILEMAHSQSMQEVKQELLKELAHYQGTYDANDDITIVGVRI